MFSQIARDSGMCVMGEGSINKTLKQMTFYQREIRAWFKGGPGVLPQDYVVEGGNNLGVRVEVSGSHVI